MESLCSYITTINYFTDLFKKENKQTKQNKDIFCQIITIKKHNKRGLTIGKTMTKPGQKPREKSIKLKRRIVKR